jgi:hypothetical protein
MAEAVINPHYHDPNVVPSLEDLKVEYLGRGEWELPDDASIESMSGGDDWLLTLADGTEYRVSTEEGEVGSGTEDLLDKIFRYISPEELKDKSFEEIRTAIVTVNADLIKAGSGLTDEEVDAAAEDIGYLNRETKTFEEAGKWWLDENIPLIKKAGSTYALHGWNGDQYSECWKCGGDDATEMEGSYTIKPILNQVTDEETEIIDYEVNEN